MKKIFHIFLIIPAAGCLLSAPALSAQEQQPVATAQQAVQPAAQAQEAATAQKSETEVKKGWAFGAFPCLSYSNDMGFQYGAFGDVYYYGDGSTYPDPLHKLSFEVSHYTKGRTRAYLSYDTKYLIPNMRMTVSATYVNDPLYLFYGFNGAASPYYGDLDANKNYFSASPGQKGYPTPGNLRAYGMMGVPGVASLFDGDGNPYGISYYHMRRDMVRVLADFQGNITEHLKWAAGISYWWFKTGEYNAAKYKYDPAATMYNHYVAHGLIDEKEKNGGHRLEIKGGLVWDNRDIEAAPNKGIWAELYFNGSPSVTGDGYHYLNLCAHFRHYVRIPVGFIKAGDPVFAYHLAYQGNIAGNVPFYMQQNITALVLKQMISEGFGSYNTVRGTYSNRLIANGYAWANAELRIKFWSFKLWKQYFYFATNPFFDVGVITQPYRLDRMAALPEVGAFAKANGYDDPLKFLRAKTFEPIYTLGIGLKLAWNQNFIVSVEVAHNFNKGMGAPVYISIGTHYSF